MVPYTYTYELPPGMTYADAGRLKLQRLVNIGSQIVWNIIIWI